MNQDNWDKVDAWLVRELIKRDAVLDHALATSATAGLRAINVAPNQGKLLQLLVRIQGARRVLEIGTLGGYSAIWMARALPPDGVLVSLEADAGNAGVARANLTAAGLADRVTVVAGLALDSLDAMVRDGTAPFDFVFIDADKSNNAHYLERVLKLAREGTVIVADNVVREGRVADARDQEDDVTGIRDFFTRLASDDALDSTAVQTVGSKGWDGFSITVVSKQTP